ncbi:right-handed parallel beta-helix repeat-containing protein [Micromonospora arida]|uniref:right-handed parallel beta-helix repeat-containing protein n=1 Tax=Micromonospora arida TaxID=2203715 RepID=UPI0033A70DE1
MTTRIPRRAVTLAGAAGALAAVVPPGRADAAIASTSLPVLGVADDWNTVLARTPQVQLTPGATYTLPATVALPDRCLIVGNGATVTVPTDQAGALSIVGRNNVSVSGVHFLGRQTSPVDSAPQFAHVGVRISRSNNVRILDCDFTNWRGAGLAVTGSAADDYFGYRLKVSGNAFHRCHFGVSLADRSEYSQLTANSFTSCRLAIWNSSGNWTINGNVVVGCYGAYYSFAQTSPYGSLASDNWGHGSLTGNTINHCNGGVPVRWSSALSFPIGGVGRNPGTGVVVDGVLPPTFTGNTLWYSDIRATNLQGTRWMLSGCTLSNLTVSCTGTAPVHLLGNQANSGGLPVLQGNVKDLLPL